MKYKIGDKILFLGSRQPEQWLHGTILGAKTVVDSNVYELDTSFRVEENVPEEAIRSIRWTKEDTGLRVL